MLRVNVKLETRLDVYTKVRDRILALGGGFTKVGFPSEGRPAAVPDGYASDISEVAQVAAFNEFGTVRIPARPFFRQALDNNREALISFTSAIARRVMDGTVQPRQGLQLIGEWMAAKIKASITSGDFLPNSPITIARKKSSRPLIDTGQMRQSVTHVEHIA